jgi:hypothetical protein
MTAEVVMAYLQFQYDKITENENKAATELLTLLWYTASITNEKDGLILYQSQLKFRVIYMLRYENSGLNGNFKFCYILVKLNLLLFIGKLLKLKKIK